MLMLQTDKFSWYLLGEKKLRTGMVTEIREVFQVRVIILEDARAEEIELTI